ncbi:MAG TPA: ASCH domain-containing protein [Opitutaceae bacterium]|nr:ASCH domain-containing protein [Opitutaceae bacterium]
MKALSLWQPWASAIPAGLKKIETRGWSTRYRGRLAIHAAKTHTEALREWYHWNVATQAAARDAFAKIGVRDFEEIPLGCIVATCDLIDCVPTVALVAGKKINPVEALWGNYAPERFGWLLDNIVALKEPIPCLGKQGLFEWDPNAPVKQSPSDADFFRDREEVRT